MQWGLNVHQQPRQLDKRFSDLKLCQREQIAKWLREETNDYYTRHQRYPIGREAEDVVDNVKRYARNGSIITFHDSLKSIDKLKTALPKAIEWLQELGYEFKIFK